MAPSWRSASVKSLSFERQRLLSNTLHRLFRWNRGGDPMNIKQIETFVRIVELGSFSAAAEALFASQSTVSARIKDLERYLGAELFDRSFHRAKLTPKGHELFDHARQLVEFTTSLTRQLRDPQAMTGVVHIGVVGVVANTWLPALVNRLRQRYPGVGLRIDASLTRLLMERLREGRLDLAIVAGAITDPSLHSEVLGYDEFVWMASPALSISIRWGRRDWSLAGAHAQRGFAPLPGRPAVVPPGRCGVQGRRSLQQHERVG